MKKIRFGWIFCLGLFAALMLTSARPAGADEPGDLYLRVLKIIQQADNLESGGQTGPALDKYREAWKVLQGIKKDNPAWNREAVTYRFNFVAEKLDGLSRKLATPAKTGPAAAAQESASDAASPVKLLEAGAEPRKVLRLHPKPGDKQTLEVTFKTATGMGAGGPSLKLPAIKLALNATVKSVSPEGDITCELAMGQASVLDEPGSAPKLVEEMKKAVSSFNGISGTLTLSDRGMVKGTQMKASLAPTPGSPRPWMVSRTFSRWWRLRCPNRPWVPAPNGRSRWPSRPKA